MADYTSTQNGNWNVGATWVGGVAPSLNGDTATIGHEVTYNLGDSAVTWGNVTINASGVLIFPIAADSTMRIGDGAGSEALTINSGGELRAGTDGAPIAAANHCYIYFQRLAGGNSLVCNNGGIINVYGDTAFYGTTIAHRYADLDSNWTAGQTLYVTGDYKTTALWKAGQKFWIHENKKYVDYTSDGHIYTIASVAAYDAGNDRTAITISEAAPGLAFTTVYEGYQSKLIMLSRNVELADDSMANSWTVNGFAADTEACQCDNNSSVSDAFHLENCVFRGWASGIGNRSNASSLVMVGVVSINNGYGIVYGDNPSTITSCDIVSCYQGMRDVNESIITDTLFASTYRCIHESRYLHVEGEFISCNQPIRDTIYIFCKANWVSCAMAWYNADLGQHISGSIIGCTYLADNAHGGRFTDVDVRDSGGFYYVTHASTPASFAILENCSVDEVRHALRIYQFPGNWLPLDDGDGDWQAPHSGMDWILQAVPNSNCTNATLLRRMALSPHAHNPFEPMAQYVEAAETTITFKIWPVGWTASLDQDDIYLEAWYLDSAAGVTRTRIVTTSETYANGAWREMTVTFTAAQAGIVYFNLVLAAYEAAAYVLIDVEPTFS